MGFLKKNWPIALLLCAVFLLPFFSAKNFSSIYDERTHLPSGYSYLKTGKIQLNSQHPPLIKELAAVPLLFLKPVMPELSADASEWKFGVKFLFGSGNDPDKLLLWGRLAPMLISVLLGFFVYKWTSELANHGAGLAALFLYAFMSNILAHAQFVTMDLGVSAFSFITLYWLWKYFRTGSHRHLIFTGLFLGLALGSKFSALLLVPIILILVFIYLWSYDYHRFHIKKLSARMVIFFKIIIPISLISFFVVYALYFFPKDLLFYWNGLTSLYADKNQNSLFYLNGNFSQTGWWYYFIFAFLIKTSIPFLILLVGATVYYKRARLSRLDGYFIAIPMFVFFIITSCKAHNIGVRYILPVYPFLIMPAGWLLAELFKKESQIKIFSRKSMLALAAVLVSWHAFSALRAYPDFLAYSNEFIGGSGNGYKYLDDSNLSWGQDLKRLKEYQIKNPQTKVVFGWEGFGFDYYGIKNDVFKTEKWWSQPQGRYAINANLIIRTKLRAATHGDTVDWLKAYQPIDKIGQSFFIYQF